MINILTRTDSHAVVSIICILRPHF